MNDLGRSALVFLGAGAGGVARFFLDRALLTAVDHRWPVGTFAINVTGCLLIGMGFVVFKQEYWRLLLLTGVLGGYTTFSTFGRETVTLMQEGRWGASGAYVVGSLVLGVVGVWVGMKVGGLVVRG